MKRIVIPIAVLLIAALLLPASAVNTHAQGDPHRVTLESLELVDEHPLYTMTYAGAYAGLDQAALADARAAVIAAAEGTAQASWGCSLFAVFADPDHALFGRNFDWQYSPALLLFTDPPDGYASVSMVDIAYLGFRMPSRARSILDLPFAEREALLYAPYIPFDGMNEYGLTVGMAAVPPGNMQPDPAKDTIGSLMAIRVMLDTARTVDEAVAVLEAHNIDVEGGPPVHYLIADATGRAVLAEFFQGELHVLPNVDSWHHATNFLVSSVTQTERQCWRYDVLTDRLADSAGALVTQDALDLLETVSQSNTQWSIAYGYGSGAIDVVMGRDYERVHSFTLPIVPLAPSDASS